MGMFGGFFKNFNAPGGAASRFGLLADSLSGQNTFANAQQQPIENDFKNRQLDVQKLIAGQRADTEPAVIKALRAANIDPTSPQGQVIIQNNLNRPIIAGSPEGGFTAMGGAFGMPVPQPQAGGPQIGTVEDGYVFMGGDPASPTSWKKQ